VLFEHKRACPDSLDWIYGIQDFQETDLFAASRQTEPSAVSALTLDQPCPAERLQYLREVLNWNIHRIGDVARSSALGLIARKKHGCAQRIL
jgi:hypothetical protein